MRGGGGTILPPRWWCAGMVARPGGRWSLVGDHYRFGGPGHGLPRAERGVVFGVEVLPPEEDAWRGGGGDGLPGLLLVVRGALPVHVDDDRKVAVPGVQPLFAGDHRKPELVQHQELLRQVVPGGQRGQPAADAIDLIGAHAADLFERTL